MIKTENLNYIIKYFAFGDFEFWDPTQMKVLATAKDLSEFQNAIKHVTEDCLMYHATRSEFSKWLKSRALFPLANLLSVIEYDEFENNDQIREFLNNSIKSLLSSSILYKFFSSSSKSAL